MKALLLSDGEFATKQLGKLDALVKQDLGKRGYEIAEKRLTPGELACCTGCFGCWIKTPGKCVIKDAMDDINRQTIASDVVILSGAGGFRAVFRQHEKRH